MKIKSGVFSFLLIFCFCPLFAGTYDSIGVTKINSKLHVKYLVSPGETIYGISTRYGVPVSDLMEINPELENGLKVGQVINIPYNPEAVRAVKKYDDNTIVHKVQPGETFYSLSKKYNTSIDELMKLNNIQLKAGQEIVVGYKDRQPAAVANTSSAAPATMAATPNAGNEAGAGVQQEAKPVAVNTSSPSPAVQNEVKQEELKLPEKKAEPVAVAVSNTPPAPVTAAPAGTRPSDYYPYDSTRKQVLVIPFDPYLYFSDADDEIAARSNLPRTKVRQVFRKRLNAMLDAPGYETIHLLGGKAKDSLSDMNKIYSMVTYNYQNVVLGPYYQEEVPIEEVKKKTTKNWIERQKVKLMNQEETTSSKYNVPEDYGNYFGVVIKNPEFWTYFNNKYSIDYYIFVSQFEVKTNYEHCLDRAAQNYERTFTTHFSIFDNTGKQIAGNKFKTHYGSNSNLIYQIVADNVEKIANRILQELPPPGNH